MGEQMWWAAGRKWWKRDVRRWSRVGECVIIDIIYLPRRGKDNAQIISNKTSIGGGEKATQKDWRESMNSEYIYETTF